MNILILSPSFYGKGCANGVCAQNLFNQFRKDGHNAFFVGYGKEQDCNYKDKYVNSFSYHCPLKKVATGKINRAFARFMDIILHTWTPKYDKKLAQLLFDEASKMCAKEKIDIVVSVFFPIESLIAGSRIKKAFPGIKFVIYELDSIGDGIASKDARLRYKDFSYRRFLGSMYKCANSIMVLESHDDYWSNSFKSFIEKKTSFDLPVLVNKTKESIFEKSFVCFVYAGSLDFNYRSPTKMIDVFLTISKRINCQLLLFSNGCDKYIEDISKAHSNIFVRGYVPQSVLDEAVFGSTILINIGNRFSKSVPSKLISYMSYGKPIVNFENQKNDVCKPYLNNYPYSLTLDSNLSNEECASAIESFIHKMDGKAALRFEEFSVMFNKNLPRFSADLIYGVLENKIEKKA